MPEPEMQNPPESSPAGEADSAQQATAAPPDDILQPVWATSQVELAKQLGCDRKTVQRLMKIDGNPGKTSDGRYNVTAWKLWCMESGHLKKKTAAFSTKADLEIEGQRLKNEKLELENAVTRGELMHVDEVSKVLTEMMGAFVSGIRGMKHSLSPQVVGMPIGEASKRIGKEVDAQLGKLALGEWAKKKIFWSSVYARLHDLHRKYNLGDGLSEM